MGKTCCTLALTGVVSPASTSSGTRQTEVAPCFSRATLSLGLIISCHAFFWEMPLRETEENKFPSSKMPLKGQSKAISPTANEG